MPYEHRLPTGRAEVDLTPEQAAAVQRTNNGARLSDTQRGALQAAVTYAKPDAAAKARAALETDEQRRKGRR